MAKRPSLAETMRQVNVAPESGPKVLAEEVRIAPQPQRADEAAPKPFFAATRVGKKKVTASLTPADHKHLKALAVERETTTEALLGEAIADLFRKYR